MSRPAPSRRGTTAGPRTPRNSHEPSTFRTPTQQVNPVLSLGTNLDVSSTVISTVTKNGGRRQARLEDLDTDALEHYSKDVVEMSLKRKITPRNAFDIKMIDCTYELLKRSDIPLTPDTGTTDEIKMYASRLETCGKIYGMRVENTRLYATDLTDDLERVAKGKRLKTKEKEETDAEGTADEAEEVRESEGEKEVQEEEVQAVEEVVTKRVKKNRKSRIIEDAEGLACAETEINANFVSRYWSLIGNVQPGVMKDSWIHQGERIENTDRLTFVMDPSLTCVQRYKHMLPVSTGSDEDTRPASQRSAPKPKKEAVQAAEKGLLLLSQQLKLNQRLTVDSCVTFTKGQEKQIAKAEQSASEKVKRNYREIQDNTVSSESLAKQFHDCCIAAVDGSVHQLVEDDPQMEEEDEAESREIVPSKFNASFQVPLDPESRDDFHGDTIVDDEEERAAVRRASDPPAENIPPIEDMDMPNNENAPEYGGSEHSSDPFRFAGQNPPPRALSENRSVRAPSEAGSTSSHKSKKGRYGSVVQEVPTVVDKFAVLNQLDTTLTSMKGLSKAEKNADFPESLTFTAEDLQRVVSLMARSKRNTTRNDSKDKLVRQLIKSPRKDAPPIVNPSRNFIELPVGLTSFDPESIVNFLAVQTKALQKNLENVLTWLDSTTEKGDNTDINKDELVLACRRVYDEDFDPDLERLQRGWGDNDDNYSLSSEDISELEDFADTISSPLHPDASTAASPAPDDRSTSHMEEQSDIPPALDDFPADPPINPEKINEDPAMETDVENNEGQVPTGAPGVGSPEQAVTGEEWRDAIAVPGNARDQDLGILSAQDVRQAGMELVREDALQMLTEEDYAPETNFEFAENIALRDCTGSGVNIGQMKLAVQKTYILLTKYRKRAWERGRGRHGAVMPYLRARHLMEWVYLMLDRKQHRHINPSVVFSCLLHLAYEKKLCLICPEDLADVYVLTDEEMSAYTRAHPHLNRLTDSYVRKLFKLPMPFSVFQPVTTASQSSDPTTATENLRPAADEGDSDESDTETASVVTSTTVTSRATSGLTSAASERRNVSVSSYGSRNLSVEIPIASGSRNASVAVSTNRNPSIVTSGSRNPSGAASVVSGSRKKRVRMEDTR